MKQFAATASIHAAPERIWAILTDAGRYPEWNSTIDRIEGRIAPGERITLHVAMNRGRAFPVRVAAFDPPRRMVWRGGMPLGLFVGERIFDLVPGQDGAVAFRMCEQFTGLLAPLIGRTIPDMQPTFDAFVADLKREAER